MVSDAFDFLSRGANSAVRFFSGRNGCHRSAGDRRQRRGCLMKGRGGELDLEKAAMLLLTDYRTGPLGRISLGTPITRQTILGKGLASAI